MNNEVVRFAVAILICPILCISAVADGPQHSGVEVDQQSILQRKAQKFGLNPNLLETVVVLERQRAKSEVPLDHETFEWLTEQSARVLRHVLKKTQNLKAVLRAYAAGSFAPDDASPASVAEFSKAAYRHFHRLEEERPWDGTYPPQTQPQP